MWRLFEVFEPYIDFWRIKERKDKVIIFLFPPIIGVICYLIAVVTHGNEAWRGYEFVNDFINQFITMLTLFISFSMAYLSVIIASDSQNIRDLKGHDIDKTDRSGKFYTLYQELVSDITCTLVTEIILLVLCIVEKFAIYIVDWRAVRIIVCVDVSFFMHIFIMMLFVVKNIYFSFWKSK